MYMILLNNLFFLVKNFVFSINKISLAPCKIPILKIKKSAKIEACFNVNN